MSEEQAKQFLEQATQSLQSGQFQQALDLAEQSLAMKETDEAFILKGISLSQLGRPDEATQALRRAITLGPYNPKAYYNLAVHYYAQGQKNEALEMAREAVRIDSKHAGARDLVTRIEAESMPAQTVQAPRIDEPIPPAGQETSSGQASPPMTGPIQPGPSAPGAGPNAPYQSPPPPGGYYRPGYETSGVHSLQFVANMGKTWDTIAWVLVAVLLAVTAVSLATNFGVMMEAFSNPERARELSGMSGFGQGGFQIMLSIVGLAARLGSLVWMILELSDRRGNWLWLLPYILCCCCGFDWLVLGIYLLAGRQK